MRNNRPKVSVPQRQVDRTLSETRHWHQLECAAGVFSSTYFSRRTHIPTITIHDLPAEILLLIFKYVDKTVTRKRGKKISTRPAEESDLLSPSLFPYALAAVCSTWRDVMSLVPAFWTRVVILVDSNPTTLSAVELQLQWSRALPLDITVTRRERSYTMDDLYEGKRVKAVMKLIGPHLPRCLSLRFDVIYSSSLPSLLKDFHGTAPLLKHLELECKLHDSDVLRDQDGGDDEDESDDEDEDKNDDGDGDDDDDDDDDSDDEDDSDNDEDDSDNDEDDSDDDDEGDGDGDQDKDDGGDYAPPVAPDSTLEPFECPALRTLVIDGPNFYDACKNIPQWGTKLRKVTSMAISRFRPTNSRKHLSTFDVMKPLYHMPKCKRLRLTDLRLMSCRRELDVMDYTSVDHIVVEDLHDAKIINEFIDHIDFDGGFSMAITRCCLGDFAFDANCLELDEISISEDILPILPYWEGIHLSVNNCPGFGDRILHRLGHRKKISVCNMEHLVISNCTNFTVPALKRFVARRSKRRHSLEALKMVEILGEAPYFSPEDTKWFRDNLKWFVRMPG